LAALVGAFGDALCARARLPPAPLSIALTNNASTIRGKDMTELVPSIL